MAESRQVDGTSSAMWGAAESTSGTTRGAWLADSKFAMFIHWGLYSELGGRWDDRAYYGISEWLMQRAQIPAADYAAVAQRFNPVDFDATEWVQLARDAGMRHMMLTAKHHEGFAMFGSTVDSFNIVDATPFGRDPLAELRDACAAGGVRLGTYYSQTIDWHEPDAVGNTWDAWPAERDFQRYLTQKAIPQITELLTRYGPICGIWFDCPGPITPDQSRQLVEHVHALQPDCLVNSRIGNGLGDYDSLGDQEIPRLPRPGLWESPDTHNDTWAYAAHDLNWKSPTEIAQRLVRVVSRGGTYLLNVGPDGRGRIPADSAAILREVGAWVHAHEDAIHGAGPTPLGPLAWGECTARGETLYLHVFAWPSDGCLFVPGVTATSATATLDGEAVAVVARDGGLALAVPRPRPDSLIPVVELTLSADAVCEREPHLLAGCVNTLDSGVAELSGCAAAKTSWMEKFGDWHHAECVGGWSAGARATWRFRTVGPLRCYLDVDYTAPAEDDYAEWELALDDRRVTFPLLDSGERAQRQIWGGPLPRFRRYRVGVVTVDGAGEHTLSLGPTGDAGWATRIEKVTLTPV